MIGKIADAVEHERDRIAVCFDELWIIFRVPPPTRRVNNTSHRLQITKDKILAVELRRVEDGGSCIVKVSWSSPQRRLDKLCAVALVNVKIERVRNALRIEPLGRVNLEVGRACRVRPSTSILKVPTSLRLKSRA